MTREAIRDDLLHQIGIEDIANCPDHLLAIVASAVNQAIQWMRLDPQSRFSTRREETITINSGIRTSNLGTDWQTIESVRRSASGQPLRLAGSKSDIYNYCRRFLGASGETSGTVAACFIEQTVADDGDSESILYVAPVPSSNTSLIVEGMPVAPRYSADDLASTEGIPVPHGYVESVFLPLARYQISLCRWYEGDRAGLKSAAEAAAAAVGLALPWPAEATAAAA